MCVSQDWCSFVSERKWTTFGLVQTKKMQLVILLSDEKVGFHSTNLRMPKSVGTNDAIQELHPDEIAITKVPSLPSQSEMKYLHSFLYEERVQPS